MIHLQGDQIWSFRKFFLEIQFRYKLIKTRSLFPKQNELLVVVWRNILEFATRPYTVWMQFPKQITVYEYLIDVLFGHKFFIDVKIM